MKYIKFISLFILIIPLNNLKSNDKLYFDLKIGPQFSIHSAKLTNFNLNESCGCYENGNGLGFIGQGSILYNFDDFNIGLNFTYNNNNGLFLQADSAYLWNNIILDSSIVRTEKELNTSLTLIQFSPQFSYKLSDNLFNGPLWIYSRINLSLLSNSFHSQSNIIRNSPGAVFDDNGTYTKSLPLSEGDIPNLNSLLFSLSLGFENNLLISDNLFFTQSIELNQYLNNFISVNNWNSTDFIFLIGLKYVHEFPEEVIPLEEYSLKILYNAPFSPIEPIIRLTNRDIYKDLNLDINFKVMSETPLVSNIFFEKNSSEIKDFYLNQEKIESQYKNDPIMWHYQILYVLTSILKEDPFAELEITGYTSGKDEMNSLELARSRAENVKSVFIKNGIDPNRIKIDYTILPKNKSNLEVDEGKAENRRVNLNLINSSKEQFLIIKQEKKLYGSLEYKIDYLTKSFFKSKLEINDSLYSIISDSLLNFPIEKEFKDNTNEYDVIAKLKYFGKEDIKKDRVFFSKINNTYNNYDFSDFKATLLFDFASSQLSERNKKVINKIIEFLPSGKTIVLTGNTDAIGMEKVNVKLAEQRAERVKNYILSISNKFFNIITITNEEKFPEQTAQGRFLNRSVIVRIKN